MKYLLLLLLFSPHFFAQAKEGDKWGLQLAKGTNELTIGGRLQGMGSYNLTGGGNDFYLRRARVNLLYTVDNDHTIYADLRNDRSNQDDSGEGNLLIGDAFYELKLNYGIIRDITFFRSKVDLSYTQTASSKTLIHPDRARVADYASTFIVHNRRANNVQINGESEILDFQFSISDGVQGDAEETLDSTATIDSIEKQNFTYGLKTRIFLWGEKAPVAESYFGAMKTFSIGLGAFYNPNIEYNLSNSTRIDTDRTLYNLELSFAYENFRFLAEGFLFENDLLNPNENQFGTSNGYYFITEYIAGNIAPYFSYSILNRDDDRAKVNERSYLLGFNYYVRGVQRRYGVSYQSKEFDESLNTKNNKELLLYVMIDY